MHPGGVANLYQDLGDLEEAKEYQQRALKITLDKLGPEHVDVATSYINLALIYQDLGDLDNKIWPYKKSVMHEQSYSFANINLCSFAVLVAVAVVVA